MTGQRLASVEADLVPHVTDLLSTAGISSIETAVQPDRLVAIAVAPEDIERARATLDLVLPGLLESPSDAGSPGGQPLSGRLIRRSDWTADDGSAEPPEQPAPDLVDGRQAFAAALGLPTNPAPQEPQDQQDPAELDDFVPPEPPPIPRGDTVSRFAWLGAVGGPILMVLTALFGLPSIAAGIGLCGFIAGFGVLVARMPDRGRTDDGWDNGAQL